MKRQLLSFISFLCHYGVAQTLRKLISRDYVPNRMGCLYNCIMGVGALGNNSYTVAPRTYVARRILRRYQNVRIALTHRFGGGSDSYLKREMGRQARSDLMIVVAPTEQRGILDLSFCNRDGCVYRAKTDTLKALHSLRGRCSQIVINQLVGWINNDAEVKSVTKAIVSLQSKTDAEMIFLMHDYYCICPYVTLCKADGYYCNSEYTILNCKKCNSHFDIEVWRDSFKNLLERCREVRTFSQDTYERIQRIYPKVSLSLRPHAPLQNWAPISVGETRMPVVGVVGVMCNAKGAREVEALARYVDAKKINAKIVVIGPWDSHPTGLPKCITITGRFNHSELRNRLIAHKVNIALFPSRWPETFSYVVQELMQMDLPVVCYNIGAPKDRVREYGKGRVCEDSSPQATWGAIKGLFSKVYGSGGER